MKSAVSVSLIFWTFFKLGLTSFGGPVAHLGYFHHAFVDRLKWLDDKSYASLVSLCHFLPGPSSSQVGMGIGLSQAGIRGALAAWLGFTLPSALALSLFAYGLLTFGETLPNGIIHGLKLITVAVVAQALWGMARNLCPDPARQVLALATAAGILTIPYAGVQFAAILTAGLIGWLICKPTNIDAESSLTPPISHPTAVIALALFFVLLFALPLAVVHTPLLSLFESFYRSGSLVFGGGHVVLPLLQNEMVNGTNVTQDAFLAGYGAAQAVPGPLFTFASYLGMMQMGWVGAIVATLAIFLPSFLLIVGALPFWGKLNRYHPLQKGLMGVNAGVVGLLLAAFYDPIWTSAILSPHDFIFACAAFLALQHWKVPVVAVVFIGAFVGSLSSLL